MDKALLDKALALPPNERTAFAELILASIDIENKEIKQTWIDEVKERIQAVNEGRAKLLDFESLYNEDSQDLLDYSHVVWLWTFTKGTRNMGKSGSYSFCVYSFCIYLPLCTDLRNHCFILYRNMGIR